jgi:AcrR family transcriptional regulator
VSSQLLSQIPRQGLNARQAETVSALLGAAIVELRAVGHEALTVRRVAQRAGVSPATAYTYFASKNHLIAELFSRHMAEEAEVEPAGGTAVSRVQGTVRSLTARIVEEPELAAAATPALLSTDPDVARLRLRIGVAFLGRFEAALGDPDDPGQPADPAVLDVLVLTFCGALLQAGMGLMPYDQIADRLVPAVDTILRGNA